jgi:hypothetical protein
MKLVSSSFWVDVEKVLSLVMEHSRRYKRSKQAANKLERWSGWATSIGGVVFFTGEMIRQLGDLKLPAAYFAYLSLAILGLAVFSAGAVVGVVVVVRSSRRPFVEHVERIIEALGRECELIAALERFDSMTLEFACKRLQIESAKVASRLGVIGGGEGLRTSLVGIAMLGTALISQYEPIVDGWTMKSLALFGVALLLGLSIGALLARYGASQSDYYSEIIRLALQRKERMAKELREPFSRRIKRKGPTARSD